MFLCYLHIPGRVTPVHSTYVCVCVSSVCSGRYLHTPGCVTPVHYTYVTPVTCVLYICVRVVGVFLLAELPNAMLFIVMIVDNTWELVILRSLPPAPAVRRQQEARPFSSTSPLIQLQTSKSERKA